ncbi:MAG: DUF3343 domain-containing protein [Butyricicoccus sp.]
MIITFHTTAEAFQMEKAAREHGFSGRLIPVPREITAGCGLAWRDEPERQADLCAMMAQEGISCEEMRILTL